MKIKTSELTQERQWRATVGMDKERFFILLDHFKKAYFETYQEELCKKKVDVNIDYCIESEEDLLLLTLLSLKSGLTYDVLGIFCGMSASNVKRNQTIGLDILSKTWTQLRVMPKRKLLTVKDFKDFKKHIQEKKANTLKTLLISTKDKVIQYLSFCSPGSQHDFSLLKEKFPPELPWFKDFNIKVNLGFLGMDKTYSCQHISIPYKKSKRYPLTNQQKELNKKW